LKWCIEKTPGICYISLITARDYNSINCRGRGKKEGQGMRRIIAVEPGEWVILPCILETDDGYYRVDVYPDGRVEASDDERFAKADFGGPDYKRFAAIYNSQNDYMMFLRRPIPLTPEGNMPVAGGSQLAAIAAQSMLLEG
jgi:hypothetical protein